MSATHEELIEFLAARGARKADHSTVSLLEHLINVHNLLILFGCEGWVCRAGLFHSVYGTSRFRLALVTVVERTLVQSLIGERAEALAYLFCRVSVESLMLSVLRNEVQLADRDSGLILHVSNDDDFVALMWLHFADALEQFGRIDQLGIDHMILWRLASRLGPRAMTVMHALLKPGETNSRQSLEWRHGP